MILYDYHEEKDHNLDVAKVVQDLPITQAMVALVKAERAVSKEPCLANGPGGKYVCSRGRDHTATSPTHIAMTMLGKSQILLVWNDEPSD